MHVCLWFKTVSTACKLLKNDNSPTVLSLINAPGGVTFSKRGNYYVTKIIKVFPTTLQYSVQMILNNLQNTQKKKTNPNIQRQWKGLQKNLNTVHVPNQQSATVHVLKRVNTAIF